MSKRFIPFFLLHMYLPVWVRSGIHWSLADLPAFRPSLCGRVRDKEQGTRVMALTFLQAYLRE